jgi:hypothetical protein
MDTIETIYNKARTRRVRIEYDEDGSSCDPREYDELVEIVTPDLRRWNVRTEGAVFQHQHDQLYERGLGGAFARYLKIFHDVDAVPVYMYEHSNVALSTGSFIGRAQHAEWDSGMIGWAYIRPDAEKWEGMEPEKIISGFVETLGQWMNGEVYGWIAEDKVSGTKVYDGDQEDEVFEEWTEEDSCWGFIGYGYAESEAKAALGEEED